MVGLRYRATVKRMGRAATRPYHATGEGRALKDILSPGEREKYFHGLDPCSSVKFVSRF